MQRTSRNLLLAMLAFLITTGEALFAQGDDPRAVAEGFLSAWNQQDFQTMYTFVSSKSKEAFPFEPFENRYKAATEQLDFTGVEFTIQNVELQGASAVVTYDAVIKSSSFGEIRDEARVMRLVEMDGRWGVAWSSMDIFESMAGNATLTSDGTLAPRANIYDRDGNPIAYEGTMTVVVSSKNLMVNGERACQDLLANITNRPVSDYFALFDGYAPESQFAIVELEPSMYATYADAIIETCGEAYTTPTNPTRIYYGGSAMTHVVGYVGQITSEQLGRLRPLGYTADELVGQTGIEALYQQQLAGNPRRDLIIREPGGITLERLAGAEGSPPQPVTLTIDRELQVAAADAFFDAYSYAANNWGAESGPGAAVVLDVNTGEILAMVSYPLVSPMLFNPETYMSPQRLLPQINNDPRQPLRNHAIEEQFAPGSTYKVITAIATLNEEIVQPDESFYCDLVWRGQSQGDEFEFREDWRVVFDFEPAGNITPAQALMASCNPFFYNFGAKLYREKGRKLVEYSQMMGLGRKYDIYRGLVAEAPGNLDNPTRVAIAINDAIGQGDVQIPPIQMAVATAAIANDGTVYRPYLVRQVGGTDDTAISFEGKPEILSQPELQPDVLPAVREGMCGAVADENLGTAWAVFNDMDTMPTYTVCGKTGTAQTGGRSNAWFIAYAPADDPQIAIVVAVKNGGREGSEIAAPITRRILDFYFNSPVASYPVWWEEPFEALEPPRGSGGEGSS